MRRSAISSASRRWLASVFAIAMLTAGSLCLGVERPNVLMIVVEDMNDWVGCLGGHPQVQTPHIDRLAQRGLLFTNAHVPAPVCNPCRVSVLTGRRPGSTGIYANHVFWHEALPGITSLPGHFKAYGYANGDEELYDHTTDPNEWYNLAAKSEFSAEKTELAKSLPKTDAAALRSKKKPKETE